MSDARTNADKFGSMKINVDDNEMVAFLKTINNWLTAIEKKTNSIGDWFSKVGKSTGLGNIGDGLASAIPALGSPEQNRMLDQRKQLLADLGVSTASIALVEKSLEKWRAEKDAKKIAAGEKMLAQLQQQRRVTKEMLADNLQFDKVAKDPNAPVAPAAAAQNGKETAQQFISSMTKNVTGDPKIAAWCADVVSKMLSELGQKVKYSNNAAQLEKNIKAAGGVPIALKDARQGDAVFWHGIDPSTGRPYGAKSGTHTEMFAGWNNGKAMLVGSNTSAQMTGKNFYDQTQATVYRLPAPGGHQQGPPPPVTANSRPDVAGLQSDLDKQAKALYAAWIQTKASGNADSKILADAAAFQKAHKEIWAKIVLNAKAAAKDLKSAGVSTADYNKWMAPAQRMAQLQKDTRVGGKVQSDADNKISAWVKASGGDNSVAKKVLDYEAAALAQTNKSTKDANQAEQDRLTKAKAAAELQKTIASDLAASNVSAASSGLDKLNANFNAQMALAKNNAAQRLALALSLGKGILGSEKAVAALQLKQDQSAADEKAKVQQAALTKLYGKGKEPADQKGDIETTRLKTRADAQTKYENAASAAFLAQQERVNTAQSAVSAKDKLVADQRLATQKQVAEQLAGLTVKQQQDAVTLESNKLKTLQDGQKLRLDAVKGDAAAQLAVYRATNQAIENQAIRVAEVTKQAALNAARVEQQRNILGIPKGATDADKIALKKGYKDTFNAASAAAKSDYKLAVSQAQQATQASTLASEKAASDAADKQVESIRALRNQYRDLAKSIQDKAAAGKLDDAAVQDAIQKFAELGQAAQKANLGQNAYIVGAQKSTQAALAAGQAQQVYNSFLEDSEGTNKTAAEAASSLADALKSAGSTEQGLTVLQAALSSVMDAAGRGESVGQAVSILSAKILELQTLLADDTQLNGFMSNLGGLVTDQLGQVADELIRVGEEMTGLTDPAKITRLNAYMLALKTKRDELAKGLPANTAAAQGYVPGANGFAGQTGGKGFLDAFTEGQSLSDKLIGANGEQLRPTLDAAIAFMANDGKWGTVGAALQKSIQDALSGAEERYTSFLNSLVVDTASAVKAGLLPGQNGEGFKGVKTDSKPLFDGLDLVERLTGANDTALRTVLDDAAKFMADDSQFGAVSKSLQKAIQDGLEGAQSRYDTFLASLQVDTASAVKAGFLPDSNGGGFKGSTPQLASVSRDVAFMTDDDLSKLIANYQTLIYLKKGDVETQTHLDAAYEEFQKRAEGIGSDSLITRFQAASTAAEKLRAGLADGSVGAEDFEKGMGRLLPRLENLTLIDPTSGSADLLVQVKQDIAVAQALIASGISEEQKKLEEKRAANLIGEKAYFAERLRLQLKANAETFRTVTTGLDVTDPKYVQAQKTQTSGDAEAQRQKSQADIDLARKTANDLAAIQAQAASDDLEYRRNRGMGEGQYLAEKYQLDKEAAFRQADLDEQSGQTREVVQANLEVRLTKLVKDNTLARAALAQNEFRAYMQLGGEVANAFAGLAGAIGQTEQEYDSLTGAKLQTPWKDLAANLDGVAKGLDVVMNLASDVMAVLANPTDIKSWVKLFVGVVKSIADALSGFKKAAAEVAKNKADFAEQNPLLNAGDYQKTFTRSRGFFANVFGGGPEVVNEIDKIGLKAGKTIADSVYNGLDGAFKKYRETGNFDDFQKTLTTSVYEGVAQGLEDAFKNDPARLAEWGSAIKAYTDAYKLPDSDPTKVDKMSAAIAGLGSASKKTAEDAKQTAAALDALDKQNGTGRYDPAVLAAAKNKLDQERVNNEQTLEGLKNRSALSQLNRDERAARALATTDEERTRIEIEFAGKRLKINEAYERRKLAVALKGIQLQMDSELAATGLTEEQKAVIREKYRLQSEGANQDFTDFLTGAQNDLADKQIAVAEKMAQAAADAVKKAADDIRSQQDGFLNNWTQLGATAFIDGLNAGNFDQFFNNWKTNLMKATLDGTVAGLFQSMATEELRPFVERYRQALKTPGTADDVSAIQDLRAGYMSTADRFQPAFEALQPLYAEMNSELKANTAATQENTQALKEGEFGTTIASFNLPQPAAGLSLRNLLPSL